MEEASLLYREPALYAEMADAEAVDTAAAIVALADRHGPAGADSLLDVGCGTGAVLEQLACKYSKSAGVDLLPGMIEISRERRPQLETYVGDMRTIRLGRSFEVVTCIGNALAYLTAPDDIEAAFATFAGHCVPGGVLVIRTLTAFPPLDRSRTSRTRVSGRSANVTTTYTRDPAAEVLILTRHWDFEDREPATDVIRRRVLTIGEQESFAAAAGFTLVRPRDEDEDMTIFIRDDAGDLRSGVADD
ncbi:class I SAM-dependent methyltransferase [Catenulispora acidiphila]|uniref:class I SAM-dependent methyltransferase n=1 Tax=Catenulispora acidiphila TaxID=304895 RepID=UPI00019E2CD1|nr:class I SAM-dependent methyltransferase [Catenulispora acidiphila]